MTVLFLRSRLPTITDSQWSKVASYLALRVGDSVMAHELGAAAGMSPRAARALLFGLAEVEPPAAKLYWEVFVDHSLVSCRSIPWAHGRPHVPLTVEIDDEEVLVTDEAQLSYEMSAEILDKVGFE
ncbi:MAG TPA: hypothetical protein VLC09_20160 [Polyangiaceae bacterium]|nr:hypothetical protein [Polyangiaceae bacterium]